MRKNITLNDIDSTLADIRKRIIYRLDQKGYGTFVGSHEILGVITEEYNELIDTIHHNNNPHINPNIKMELLDIAVASILGMISVDSEVKDGKI